MKRNWGLALVVLSLLSVSVHAETKVETVAENLDNPCGVAVQPNTGHVFVSDSGAAKIVRIVDGKTEDVITDFPIDVYGKGPMYNIGPLGLAFIDEKTLVVGGGGLKDGEELLRVYEVPAAGEPAIKADAMVSSKSLPAADDVAGEGNFYALAVTPQGVFVTANGDDTKGWVAKAEMDGKNIKEFTRSIPTKETTETVDAPVGIAVMPKQGHLVVGQMGEINKPQDSLITFYNVSDGKAMLNLETGLYDITGLAYSSKTGQLYATDFAWMKTEEGGLFRLVKDKTSGDQKVKLMKITELDKPTALAFDNDGNLYLTVIGTAKEGEDAKPGKLLKIAADAGL